MAKKAVALEEPPGQLASITQLRSTRAAATRRRVAAPSGARSRAGHDVDDIFERVRNAVLDQRMPPGMQLKEQPLANAFKVSRSVIRQVLTKLENCRLAVHRPNRGVFVATPSISEGRDIFLARQAIECAIIDSLIDTITQEQVDEVRILVEKEQAAHHDGDLRLALRCSIEFHRALARFSGNAVLRSFLEELIARTPLVILAYKRLDLKTCGLAEHTGIVSAIEARDKKRAAALMREHIQHVEALLDLEACDHPNDTDIASLFGYDSFS